MSELLPLQVDLGFCEHNRQVTGYLDLGLMERVRESAGPQQGQVLIALEFGIDKLIEGVKTRFVRGQIETVLSLSCQRCLEPMKYDLSKQILIGFAENRRGLEEIALPYEPFLIEDGRISLSELVEDEIILALPLIAKHDDGVCPAQHYMNSAKNTETKTPSPFQVLQQLKKL